MNLLQVTNTPFFPKYLGIANWWTSPSSTCIIPQITKKSSRSQQKQCMWILIHEQCFFKNFSLHVCMECDKEWEQYFVVSNSIKLDNFYFVVFTRIPIFLWDAGWYGSLINFIKLYSKEIGLHAQTMILKSIMKTYSGAMYDPLMSMNKMFILAPKFMRKVATTLNWICEVTILCLLHVSLQHYKATSSQYYLSAT